MLSQRELRDAAVNFDTYRILQYVVTGTFICAKHGNLVDADAAGAKASTKRLESRLEVIQGHAFWDHWKDDDGLYNNNVGFVGNFEGKVWTFLRTPLQHVIRRHLSIRNPRAYSHKSYILLETTFIRLHFAIVCASVFIVFFVVGFESRMLCVKQVARRPSLTWNSHSRSF